MIGLCRFLYGVMPFCTILAYIKLLRNKLDLSKPFVLLICRPSFFGNVLPLESRNENSRSDIIGFKGLPIEVYDEP